MANTDRHINPAHINGWIRDFNDRSSGRNLFVSDMPRQTYYAPSIMSESQVPRSNTSWATSATPYQDDVFDGTDSGSFYSMSTAPSLNGPQRQRQFLPIPAPAHAAAPPASRLVCEFVGYHSCDETFSVDEEDAWIEHVAYHLHYIFPAITICWFCNEEYRARSGSNADFRACFRERMYHIADHFRRGLGVDQMRPDHYFLNHLHQYGLITDDQFNHGRDFHELPQTENLYPAGWRPPTEERVVVQEDRRRSRQSRHGHGHRHVSSRSSGHHR
ncbi:hypothetical protein AK830_g811 [Neonectria ditissima]|uniref:Uncharacterized protein n=1 Tax=Neonectria ditissima TaxID=78410 RepID=A0A0P7BGE2_9HYPO|nr:hypothetical protein AK830_g811 [Neonectria ditissima]